MKTSTDFSYRRRNSYFFKCVIILYFICFSLTSYATNYFVSNSGNDSNNGTSISTPWKTIDKVNTITFLPGDQILFRNGETFYGGLVLKGNGTATQLITVGAYDGYSIKPKIEGEGHVVDAILLQNISYWHIKDLEITNYGAVRGDYRSGITLRSNAGSVVSKITVSNLTIHHTNSTLGKADEGAGIYIDAVNTGSRFDSVTIENNYLFFVDRNGISQRTVGNASRSTNMIIRNNLLENIGGDCIKLWGSNGGLIEHNIVRGGMRRAVDASAGIWPFESDNSLIQYNEVSGMERCIDGQAFDSDYSCNNSIFQYNYSHDNEGGFFLLCAPNTMASNGAIIRYNISQNDGIAAANYPYPGTGYTEGATFTIGGHVTNSQIYNNIIYIKDGLNIPLIRTGSWDGGVPSNNFFTNNLFYVDGAVSYIFNAGDTPVFDYNVFYGTHTSKPTDPHGITSQPNLVSVNSGGDGMNTLNGYKYSALNTTFAGKLISDNGGKDFWGNVVSQLNRPLIGAHDIPTGLAPDTIPPTAPTNLSASSISATSFILSWDAATDAWKANTLGSTLSYNVTGLSVNTTYSMTVIAKDQAGNWTLSSAINVTTIDTIPPTAPTNLSGSLKTANAFTLSWNAATDNVGIMQYEVYVNGIWKANTSGSTLSYRVTGLSASTTYTMTVIAKDYAGNWTLSAPLNVKTNSSGLMALNDNIITQLESDKDLAIKIYPNPATEFFTISNIERNASVSIFNIYGKSVYSANQPDHGDLKLSVSGWQKGNYVVRIVSENKVVSKIVVVD